MYDEHFGLTARPFQLTPDPAFWYETATHRRAMAYLGYGLAQGEGFIVITGDIGAGKTTLMGHLLDTLDREALNPIRIVSSAIEAADLLRVVAAGLGVDPAGLEKAQLLAAIERGLHAVARTGRRTLLVVDEAQALPTASLEELRMLSNFQAGGHALLQIVLLGQPEFRDALGGTGGLEQLRQRVIAIHHLEPMAAGEVAAYVRHRLSVVGWTGRPGFADDAFAALHRHSDGVPRRLNQLASRVMLHAAIERLDTIDAASIDAVAADLSGDLPVIPRPVAAPAVEPVVAAPIDAEPAIEPVVADAAPAAEPAPADPAPAADPVESDRMPEAPTAPAAEAQPFTNRSGDRPTLRPFRHSWLMTAAEPELEPEPAATPVPAPAAAEWSSDETAAPVAGEAAAGPFGGDAEAEELVADPALADRLAALEARIEEQDAALRRVLTLMVDWVEGEQVVAVTELPPPAPLGYVPIRGAAA